MSEPMNQFQYSQISYIRLQVDGHTVVDFVNGSRVCSCGLVRGHPPDLRDQVAEMRVWAQTQAIESVQLDASPDCPVCGHPPIIRLSDQVFCGNEDCRCLTWNPKRTPAENLADFTEIEIE